MPATTVIITFQAKPGCAHDFAAAMASTKLQLPQVAGCRGVRLFAATDGHTFTLIEEWDSATAHRDHLARVLESGAWDDIAAQLACDPLSRYYVER